MTGFMDLTADDDDGEEAPVVIRQGAVRPSKKRIVLKRPSPFSVDNYIRVNYDWREKILDSDIKELQYLFFIGSAEDESQLKRVADQDNEKRGISHDYCFRKIKASDLSNQINNPSNYDRLKAIIRDERLILSYAPNNLNSKKTKRELSDIVDAAHGFAREFNMNLAANKFQFYFMNDLKLTFPEKKEQIYTEIQGKVNPHIIILTKQEEDIATTTKIVKELKAIYTKKRRDRSFNFNDIKLTKLGARNLPTELEDYTILTTDDRSPHRVRAELQNERSDSFYLQKISENLESLASNTQSLPRMISNFEKTMKSLKQYLPK